MEHRDAIVMGAGPAGLTAGAQLARCGLSTTILEEKTAGGYAAEVPFLENYPGCIGELTGKDLVDRMVRQCGEAGAEIRPLEKVVGLTFGAEAHAVATEKSRYSAPVLLIASGRHERTLGVPGESRFHGRGVSHCAVCDAFFFKGRRVLVVGDDSRAAEAALFIARSAARVQLICRREQLCAENILVDRCREQGIEVLARTEILEIKGDDRVRGVVAADTETRAAREIETDGVFVQLQGIPNSELARTAGIEVDGDGYVVVDPKGRTNVERVYAIGDVAVSPAKLIVTAVAQAVAAAHDAVERFHRDS